MNPTPSGWPRLSSGLTYKEPAKMLDWLCQAFGFEIRLKVEGENGALLYSELAYGEALMMLNGERLGPELRFGMKFLSPATAGGITQHLMIFVDDVDAHCAQARAAGAVIADEPALHDYGEDYWADRSYGAVDPEGHLWWFTQRIRG